MLRWRLLLGFLFIAALVGLLWLDFATVPGAWLLGLVLIVGLAAAHEVVALLAAMGHSPLAGVIYGGTLLVLASNAIPLFATPAYDDRPAERLSWPLLAFVLTMLVALVAEMGRYRRGGAAIVNVALEMFAVAYVGLLLSVALQLRMVGGPIKGMLFLAALIVVVKLADVGAYTVGRLVGRHKMSPNISPGKTIEGACGAIVFGCLGAWFVLWHVPLWTTANRPECDWRWLVFGLAVGGAGLLGDLAESLLKREAGVKDSSTWLPGFGGVLDLLDSILFAAPVAYLCALFEMT